MVVYILFFAIAALCALVSAQVVRRIALRAHITDSASSAPDRKRHVGAVPLLGGWPIAFSVLVSLGIGLLTTRLLTDSFLSYRQLIGLAFAILVLVIGGTLDDKKNLSPLKQLFWPIVSAAMVVVFGVGVEYITHPFGGVLQLDSVSFPALTLQGVTYSITLWSDIFTIVWLLVVMYATKLLDGLDGLASGVGTIAAIVLFILSLRPDVNQPGTALFASIIAGAFFGFWVLNKYPAKLFLGEGGSLLVGFLLGILAIISGAKVATAMLILALPLLDILWVIIGRIIAGKRIFSSDRRHLHFRLIDSGMRHQHVVWLLYTVAVLFGLVALASNTKLKFILLLVAIVASALLLLYAQYRKKKHENTT